MQVRADDLPRHLQRGVAPLYVVHGDEPLLALEAGDTIRAAARGAGAIERDVFVVEAGFRWDAFLAANANMGLFGDRRFVDLRIPSGKPGVEGGKALEAYAANVNPDNVTLVTLPRLAREAQSSAWFAGDGTRALRILGILQSEGDAPIQAIWQLVEDVHAIAAVHAMVREGTPMSSAIRNVRVWGKRQSALMSAVNRVTPASVPPLLLALQELDALSKGLGRGDPWDALADVALAVCGKPLFA